LRNCYAVLGVEASASRAEITRAYRLGAMRWHPDRNPGREAEAEARFKELGDARAVLLDPLQRGLHDRALHEPTARHHAPQDRVPRATQRPAERPAAKPAPAMPRASGRWGAHAAAPRATGGARWLWCTGAGLLLALGVAGWWFEGRPGSSAAPAVAPSNWGALLPPAVTSYDDHSGVGVILHAALPEGSEFDRLRRDVGKPFRLQLLRTVPLPDARRLLLFVSAPSGFECAACHPLISAMVVRQRGDQGAQVLVPLQVVTTAGRDGRFSLDGEREPRLLEVGPDREGFYFTDQDGELGSSAEWTDLFAIEAERVRFLGSVPAHSETAGDGACRRDKASPCARQDTKFRFSKAPGPSGFYDILATEVDTAAARDGGAVTQRSYTLRFDGERYARLTARSPSRLD
jgi:curved DNA-binding protein CbpA